MEFIAGRDRENDFINWNLGWSGHGMVTDAKRYLIELLPLASVDSVAYDLLYFYLGRL